jgi:hypothetical protein
MQPKLVTQTAQASGHRCLDQAFEILVREIMGQQIHLNSKSGVAHQATNTSGQSTPSELIYLKQSASKPALTAKRAVLMRRNASVGFPKALWDSLIHPLLGQRSGAKNKGVFDELPPSYEEAMLDKAAEEAWKEHQQIRLDHSTALPQEANPDEAGSNEVTGTSVVHTRAQSRPDFLDQDLQQLATADHLKLLEMDKLPLVPEGWDIQQRPAKAEDVIYMLTEKLGDGRSRGYSASVDYEKQHASALEGEIGQAFAGLANQAASAIDQPAKAVDVPASAPTASRQDSGERNSEHLPATATVFAALAQQAAQEVFGADQAAASPRPAKSAIAGASQKGSAAKPKRMRQKDWGPPAPAYIPAPPPPVSQAGSVKASSRTDAGPPAPRYIPAPPPRAKRGK